MLRGDAVAVVGGGARVAVVHTYANRERYAVKNLANQGFDAFCPLENRPVRAGVNKGKTVEMPLFPCYAFVRLLEDQPWMSINSTYGVIRILTVPGAVPRPMMVRDIDARVAEALAKLQESAVSPFAPGTIVRVVSGPLTSFEGTVEGLDGHRLMVLMSIFDRNTRVTFDDPSMVEPLLERSTG